MAILYPGTLTNLISGPAYWYWALFAQARPTKLDDIITMATPYTVKSGWNVGGATPDGSGMGYSREMESSELGIEQQAGAVLEKIESTTRTLTIPIAEISPAAMQIAEAAPAPTTIAVGAGASGTPAQSRLDFGPISSLPRYRVAIIAERDPGLGSVGEASTRGLLAGVVLYNAAITTDASDLELSRGDLTGRELTFRAFPDSAVTDPLKQHGAFIFETGNVVP